MSTEANQQAAATPADRARALFKALKDKDLIPEGFIESFTKNMEVD